MLTPAHQEFLAHAQVTANNISALNNTLLQNFITLKNGKFAEYLSNNYTAEKISTIVSSCYQEMVECLSPREDDPYFEISKEYITAILAHSIKNVIISDLFETHVTDLQAEISKIMPEIFNFFELDANEELILKNGQPKELELAAEAIFDSIAETDLSFNEINQDALVSYISSHLISDLELNLFSN